LENEERRVNRHLFGENGPLYFGTYGLPRLCIALIRRTLDQWAGEKDNAVGDGEGRVGEAVGGFSGDSYLSELLIKYYSDDGSRPQGVHDRPTNDQDLAYLLCGVLQMSCVTDYMYVFIIVLLLVGTCTSKADVKLLC